MKTGRRKRVMAKIRTGDDPILSTVCNEVMNGDDVSGIIRDMMYILTNSKTGVGLSANQAGHAKRIIIVQFGNFGYVPMINPVIISTGKTKLTDKEGCLSHLDKGQVDVSRWERVDYTYKDESGNEINRTSFDFSARIVQHEIDHLNGKCKVSE